MNKDSGLTFHSAHSEKDPRPDTEKMQQTPTDLLERNCIGHDHSMNRSRSNTSYKNPLHHLVAGACAGLLESSICHPLDTLKTRLQLSTQASQPLYRISGRSFDAACPGTHVSRTRRHCEPLVRATSAAGIELITSTGTMTGGRSMTTTAAEMTGKFLPRHEPSVSAPLIGTAKSIVQQEGVWALYKGIGAAYAGIIPKMAIRFLSFEQYKGLLHKHFDGNMIPYRSTHIAVPSVPCSSFTIFSAGLLSGLTEAVLVVTPTEVCKIRLQGQIAPSSTSDLTHQVHKDRKYTNVFQTATTIVREEGICALYKGIIPTMLRQGCNQGCNFTAFQYLRRKVMEYQGTTELRLWQSLLIGGLSGGIGPLVNNPLDVVKTRLQKQVVIPRMVPKYTGLIQACVLIAKEEGIFALWRGITPRLLRIMPGQAITFSTYDAVSSFLHHNIA